jgi:transposase-like protein
MEGRRKSTSREEWQRRVQRWRDSGLSTKEFAAEVGINPGTLTHWKYIFGKTDRARRVAKAGETPDRPPLSFLEIQTLAPAPGAFEIVLAGGRCLRVPATFEAESLKRLIAVIEDVAH